MNEARMYDLVNAYAQAREELAAAHRLDFRSRRVAAKVCLVVAQELATAYSPGTIEHSAWLRLAADAASVLMAMPPAREQQGIADTR